MKACLRLTAAVIVLVLLSCAAPRGTVPPGRRVVLVGVEGATWRVLRPLLAQGSLPHLARLYQNGSAGILRAEGTLDTGALATVLATGLPAAENGIQSSIVRVPGRHTVRPATADLRATPALWSLAGAREITVGVAGWPVTFPAEAVNGYMLAPRYDPASGRLRGYIQPPGALGEGGEAHETVDLPAWIGELEALDTDLREAIARDRLMLEQAVSLYRVYQPRLAFFRLSAADLAAHRYWQFYERNYLDVAASRGRSVPRERSEALAAAIPGAYRFVDACIGALMERLPEGATLVIASEHGLRGVQMTDYLRVDLAALLERLGLLRRAADGAPDWQSTSVFPLPDTMLSPRRLCLNIKGREESGLVAPDRAAALRQEVAGRLRGLVTLAGQPLFKSVQELDAPGAAGADLEVIENLEIEPEGVLKVAGARVQARDLFRRVSEDFAVHDPDGILIAAGGGIAPGRYGWSARLVDVAPTLLALLGLPAGPAMQGQPIPGLLDPGILAALPPAESAPAWEPVAPLRRAEQDVAEEIHEMTRAGHLR